MAETKDIEIKILPQEKRWQTEVDRINGRLREAEESLKRVNEELVESKANILNSELSFVKSSAANIYY